MKTYFIGVVCLIIFLLGLLCYIESLPNPTEIAITKLQAVQDFDRRINRDIQSNLIAAINQDQNLTKALVLGIQAQELKDTLESRKREEGLLAEDNQLQYQIEVLTKAVLK